MEEYKEIKGFEDYQVSNYGNVKSLITNRILRPSKTNNYYKVTLCKNGEIYYKRVNRLVAEAFIPNPDNLPCVNHKDENKFNNHVDNLEWCDYQYNNNYGTKKERISAKMKGVPKSEEHRRKISESHRGILNNGLKSKLVVAIDDDGNIVHEFVSTQEAQRHGFNNSSVSQCCRGLRKTCGGYRWRYV